MDKTNQPPSPPHPTILTGPAADSPRRVLLAPADIPGLGPIRIRALTKAGLDNLASLRAASLETLLAVPGLTAIKARYIREYLGSHPPDDAAAEARPVVRARAHAAAAPAASPTPDAIAPLAAECVRTLGRTIALLLSTHAPQFRNRLLRALASFGVTVEALLIDSGTIRASDQEKAMRRLRRVSEEFEKCLAADAVDRKAQARLADAISEVTDTLQAMQNTKKPVSADSAQAADV